MRRSQAGALFEQLFVYGVMVLYCVLVAVAFSQSLALGFGMIGLTIAVGAMIISWGQLRDRRVERERVEARMRDLEQAALAHGAVIEAVFTGPGEGGVVAAFGIAGAAGRIIFARENYRKDRSSVFGFGEVTAAFARPDGGNYRLEVRVRPQDGGAPRVAIFLRVGAREEAERWVRVLQPHLGDRVRFMETAEGSA